MVNHAQRVKRTISMMDKTPELTPSLEAPRLSDDAAKEAARMVVYRVMNMDGHTGVTGYFEDGRVEYTVDNPQYEDQGDFAFSGHNALPNGINRAYPRHLSQLHAVEVNSKDVVMPYPDEAPDLVYIKNGSKVLAVPVPRDSVIDPYIEGHPDTQALDFSTRTAQALFPGAGTPS